MIFTDIYKQCCLTCQFCGKINRKMRAIGRSLRIEYDTERCECTLAQTNKLIISRAGCDVSCHYKRWVDIP
ncbi:MAG: hypothetical protein MJ025_03590 [Victivallaceae bacterium]|nr:hypothetical protein [Victivallaceae bacterium]